MTQQTSLFNSGLPIPAEAQPAEPISANTYRQMLDVLESLATHNHIFYDDYTTVCECQCQCDCSRGTL